MPNRSEALRFCVILAAILVATSVLGAASAEVDAGAAFERIKTLAGTWASSVDHSGAADEPAPQASVHEFRVSAAGSVVMETMNAGTDHEMINMYHLDGDALMITHYCSSGNQPRLRLDRGASEPGDLSFTFDDGTNLDPFSDTHIDGIRLVFRDDGTIESVWHGRAGGEDQGTTTFRLSRSRR